MVDRPIIVASLPGKASLLYVMRDPARSIDLGAQEFEAAKRLARWWGIPLKTRALGYGGYRIQLEALERAAA